MGMVALAVAAQAASAQPRTTPFILGADISWLPEREAAGRTYYDQGVRKDALLILKEHGFNSIRLRIFHNPAAPGGYSSQGYCGLEQTKLFAKRIKAAGMGFQLDFHYSDNWADPGKQVKPAAWTSLPFDGLVQAVEEHTREALQALKDQGTPPDLVQIGNEINPGMLLPDGSSSDWSRLGALLKAGVAATRSVLPAARVILHFAGGNDLAGARWFMQGAIAQGVDFDILGISCYTEWHGVPADWEATFRDLATRFPDHDFVIAEYSHEKRAANDIMFRLPGNRGLGTYIWEPLEWQEKIFDARNGRYETNALIDLYPIMSKDYGNDSLATGLAFPKAILAKDSRGRLRMFTPGQGMLFAGYGADGRMRSSTRRPVRVETGRPSDRTVNAPSRNPSRKVDAREAEDRVDILTGGP